MIKVLLVGPLDSKIPKGDLKLLTGGETTYIRSLLANPPKGVLYVHWSEALKNGQIEFSLFHSALSVLVKLRILPTSSGTFWIKLKDDFDIVHSHSNSIRTNSKIPIVLSDSSSNYLFLRDYLSWSEWRINFGYFLRRNLFKLLGVFDPDTNLAGVDKLVVFSQFAKKIHLKLGAPKERIEMIYPGITDSFGPSFARITTKKEVNILFVGTWFERKGGLILLEAFEKLSKKYSNIRLTIVGEVRSKVKSQKSKVKVYDYVPREKLMREFFPRADIFVLVPPKVEGLGFAVLEAMSFGIPVIVSDVCALPELVENGKSGIVVESGSVQSLTLALERLIKSKGLRKKMGEAARKRFVEKFSIEKSNLELLKIYKEVSVFLKSR